MASVSRLGVAAGLTAVLFSCATHAKPTYVICSLPGASTTAGRHTVRSLAATYDEAGWEHRFVARAHAGTRSDFIRWWAVEGFTACHALVGPSASSWSIGVSPLVGKQHVWISPSASSTELTDKKQHPFFSRTIPTDKVAADATVVLMQSLGWKRISTLCANTAYGRSLQQGMQNEWLLADPAHVMDASACFDSDPADLSKAVKSVARGRARILFLAMGSTDSKSVVAELKRQGLGSDFVLVTSESTCGPSLADIPGAICATYSAEQDPEFRQSYIDRDALTFQEDIDALTAAGVDSESSAFAKPPTWGVFHALAHDATRLAMQALNAVALEARINTTFNAADSIMADWVRLQTFTGATGSVVLNSTTGDRLGAFMDIFNSRPNASSVKIGKVEDGVLSMTPMASLFLLGRSYDAHFPPPDSPPLPPPEHDSHQLLIAVIAGAVGVCLLVVLAMTAIVVYRLWCAPRGRDTRHAPTDPSLPFTVAFTDIQASTALWARFPELMGEALDEHNRVARRCIEDHRGYEVKTIGDSFMVAFRNPADAVAFSVDLQRRLFNAAWEPSVLELIDQEYWNIIGQSYPGDLAADLSKAGHWRGLRVRIGVHCGRGTVAHDSASGGYDYFGTVVNTAARVQGIAHGGQVLVTQDTMDAALLANPGAEHTAGVLLLKLGAQALRGLSATVAMVQLLPADLAMRCYPPLRLDVENTVDEPDGDDYEDEDYQDDDRMSGVSRQSRQSFQIACMTRPSGAASTPGLLDDAAFDRRTKGSDGAQRAELHVGRAAEVSARAAMLRVVCRQQRVPSATAASVLEVLRAALAPCRPAERGQLVRSIADRWRIPGSAIAPPELASRAWSHRGGAPFVSGVGPEAETLYAGDPEASFAADMAPVSDGQSQAGADEGGLRLPPVQKRAKRTLPAPESALVHIVVRALKTAMSVEGSRVTGGLMGDARRSNQVAVRLPPRLSGAQPVSSASAVSEDTGRHSAAGGVDVMVPVPGLVPLAGAPPPASDRCTAVPGDNMSVVGGGSTAMPTSCTADAPFTIVAQSSVAEKQPETTAAE